MIGKVTTRGLAGRFMLPRWGLKQSTPAEGEFFEHALFCPIPNPRADARGIRLLRGEQKTSPRHHN